METRMRSTINKISRDHVKSFFNHFVKGLFVVCFLVWGAFLLFCLGFFSGNCKWDKFILFIWLFQFLIVSKILMII